MIPASARRCVMPKATEYAFTKRATSSDRLLCIYDSRKVLHPIQTSVGSCEVTIPLLPVGIQDTTLPSMRSGSSRYKWIGFLGSIVFR
jgi:hypothetical protein